MAIKFNIPTTTNQLVVHPCRLRTYTRTPPRLCQCSTSSYSGMYLRAEETGDVRVHGSAVPRTITSSTPSRSAAVCLVRFEFGLLRKSRQHTDEVHPRRFSANTMPYHAIPCLVRFSAWPLGAWMPFEPVVRVPCPDESLLAYFPCPWTP